MTAEPAQPTVCIYPHTLDSLERLAGYCDELGTQPPVCWDHRHLHMRIGDLVGMRIGVTVPVALQANAGIAGIRRDVVVFHGAAQPQVMAFIQRFKRDGHWPMLAITTPHSVNFSLAVLIEHLSDDRAREAAIRQQRANQSK